MSCHVMSRQVFIHVSEKNGCILFFLSLMLVDDKNCWLESLPKAYATVDDKSRWLSFVYI